MVVKRTVVSVERNLSNGSIVLRISTVDVAGKSSAKQRMIETGIKLNLVFLLLSPASWKRFQVSSKHLTKAIVQDLKRKMK